MQSFAILKPNFEAKITFQKSYINNFFIAFFDLSQKSFNFILTRKTWKLNSVKIQGI